MDEQGLPENRYVRTVMETIVSEMDFQRQRWGNENVERSPEEWVALFSIYIGKLASETSIYRRDAVNVGAYKRRLKQLAALASTALVELEKKQVTENLRQEPLPIEP